MNHWQKEIVATVIFGITYVLIGATAEDSAVKPASCCFAGSSVDGFNWRDDSGTCVLRSQLRHAGLVARDDADRRISLSSALFRMSGRRRPEIHVTLTSGILSALLGGTFVLLVLH